MSGESKVPETSTTLLRDVTDLQNARWAVFRERYEPMMRAFLRERFPALDAEDVLQETFVALMRALPRYVYNPKEKGFFHNYLTGVLRNKALKALASRERYELLKQKVAKEESVLRPNAAETESAEAEMQRSIYEIALQQLLADETIQERTKEVFVRIAIDGESPEAVAESVGVPYNTAIKMKQRTLEHLRRYVEALKGV